MFPTYVTPFIPTRVQPRASPGGNSYVAPAPTHVLLGIYSAACPWCDEECDWAQFGSSEQRGPYTYEIRCDCHLVDPFIRTSDT